MPRGLFSQSLCVLLERTPSLDELQGALAGFAQRNASQRRDNATWFGGFDEVLLPYREELNGHVLVDIVDRRWPDSMGDPKDEQELFGAWTMGAFGPGAYPGNLQRAVAHAFHWPEGAVEIAQKHTAIIRLRLSYVFGKGKDAEIIPEGADALDELVFLTRAARALLSLDGALAFFNPNAELLLEAQDIDARLAEAQAMKAAPFGVLCHVRFAHIGEAEGWAVMDTVGLSQLHQHDHEAIFRPEELNPNEVAGWLHQLAHYLHQQGPVIEAGHTVDGPGGTWRCQAIHSDPLMPAPRSVLRWHPEGAALPESVPEPKAEAAPES